jgi:hypothetical protein
VVVWLFTPSLWVPNFVLIDLSKKKKKKRKTKNDHLSIMTAAALFRLLASFLNLHNLEA